MIDSIKLTIPSLPPKECSPNARFHWAQKYKASQRFKQLVYLHAIQMKGWEAPQKASLQCTFVFRDNRRRDPDNYQAMFKSGLDALVFAGILIDDDSKHLIILPPKLVKGKEEATIIEIEKFLTEK